MSDASAPTPQPFDVDAWRARYADAWRAAEAAPADAGADARAAILAPLEALLEEWIGAHPGRVYTGARDPNDPPAWPPEVTGALLFVSCAGKVACARCGRRRRHLWTMTWPFRAASPMAFVMDLGADVYYPLTPVCGDHPLAPARLPEVTPAPDPDPPSSP